MSFSTFSRDLRPCRLLLTLAVIAMSASNASSAIIISFGTSTPNPLTAGGSGTLDVFIRADAGSHTLDGFLVELGISGGPAGGLVFTDPQLDAQLADPGYVFFGVSLTQNTGLPVGAVSGAGSLYTGFDTTDDGTGPPPAVGLPAPITLTTTNRLLYRLDLSAVIAGVYSITANSTGGPSFFSDQLDPITSEILFSTTPGSITVNAAAAVPEPGSALLLILGTVGCVVRHRARRRAATRSES